MLVWKWKEVQTCHEVFDEKLMEAADAGHQVPDHDMIKTPEQIEGIRESCKINVAVLDYVAEHIKAGSHNRGDRSVGI